MSEFHFPWLLLTVGVPLVGGVLIRAQKDAQRSAQLGVVITALTLVAALGAWGDLVLLGSDVARDPGDLATRLLGQEGLVFDTLSAPLVPLAALLYLLTAVATLQTKVRRFSFASSLLSEAVLLATLLTRNPAVLIALLVLGTLPPLFELGLRGKQRRVYLVHMGLFAGLLILGGWLIYGNNLSTSITAWTTLPLAIAIVIRSGVAPFHCWLTDLFEHATFGTAILQSLPLVGAYAAIRLLIPVAPPETLYWIAIAALTTSVYAAGMSLIQKEARRFYCFLYLSHSSLVLVGLLSLSAVGITGGLCLWLAVGLSLAGFGLTLRALEARHGRLSLAGYHGMYEHTPALAVCFLLSGVASVGFPGTFGFLGSELLVDGAVQAFPLAGFAVVLAAALNGIAVMQAYFKIFTGMRFNSSVSLAVGPREWFVVISLAVLIFAGGILPQPGVASRHRAAMEMLLQRERLRGANDVLVHEPTEPAWRQSAVSTQIITKASASP